MDDELADVLLQYLSGRMTRQELGETIATYDIWNGSQDSSADIVALREPVGRLELVTTEIAEGMRDEQELRDLAAALLRGAFHLVRYASA